jgi:hypothetical protein
LIDFPLATLETCDTAASTEYRIDFTKDEVLWVNGLRVDRIVQADFAVTKAYDTKRDTCQDIDTPPKLTVPGCNIANLKMPRRCGNICSGHQRHLLTQPHGLQS